LWPISGNDALTDTSGRASLPYRREGESFYVSKVGYRDPARGRWNKVQIIASSPDKDGVAQLLLAPRVIVVVPDDYRGPIVLRRTAPVPLPPRSQRIIELTADGSQAVPVPLQFGGIEIEPRDIEVHFADGRPVPRNNSQTLLNQVSLQTYYSLQPPIEGDVAHALFVGTETQFRQFDPHFWSK
jgi:hypothetical protein